MIFNIIIYNQKGMIKVTGIKPSINLFFGKFCINFTVFINLINKQMNKFHTCPR